MNSVGPILRRQPGWWWRAACLLALALAVPAAHADAADLRARHQALREALRTNPYGRPLVIESLQTSDTLRGQVFAELSQPFAVVRDALREPAHWCDIMILPFNTKYCRALAQGGMTVLDVRLGRKVSQPVEQASRLAFAFEQVAATADYFEAHLEAPDGPFGTRDYRIELSVVPLDAGRSFMRLDYAYGFGLTGRMAMAAYLATTGSGKVGFTTTGQDASGRPQYIGGMRSVVERNAMRYYLAVDAFLQSPQQAERRLDTWFDASERYARQLHEMDKATYVALKRQELERMRTVLP